jgi:hypothetical protein
LGRSEFMSFECHSSTCLRAVLRKERVGTQHDTFLRLE